MSPKAAAATFPACSVGTVHPGWADPVAFAHRFQEKGNLEVLLFSIQSKLRANNRKLYVPKEGKSISDINKVKRGR